MKTPIENYDVVVTTKIIDRTADCYYTVSEDCDRLGLVEILYYDNLANTKSDSRITISPEAIPKLIEALKRTAEAIKNQPNE